MCVCVSGAHKVKNHRFRRMTLAEDIQIPALCPDPISLTNVERKCAFKIAPGTKKEPILIKAAIHNIDFR